MANYKYWEDFIKEWRDSENFKLTNKKICGWTNPNLPPVLINDPQKKDLSSDYIPEPWWGNDGTQPLYSVVINFNPGAGGPNQLRDNFPKGVSYSKDVVWNQSILPDTRKWHKSKRAMRILNTLYRQDSIRKPYGLDNHLSVELVPWHTKGVDNEFNAYLNQNIKAVYENSICFAANRSREIENDKLHSVVIVRMNDSNTQIIMDRLKHLGVESDIVSTGVTASGLGSYMEFRLSSLSDIRFISIWGKQSWNDFPPNAEMDEIFKII